MNKQPKNHHRMVRFASVGAVNAAALAPCPRKRPKREHPLRRRKPKRQGSRNQTGKRLPMMTSEKRFVNGSDGLNTTERKQINGLCSCPQGLDVRQVQISFQPDQGEGLLFYGNVILPFRDRFPKNTELYRLMSTKPSEINLS